MKQRSAGIGPRRTEDAEDTLKLVCHRAWREPFTVSSDFARQHAEYVALAASKHLITTRIGRERYGRIWHITIAGLIWLGVEEE